ncbi:hypothetical protein [Bradyrhizobium sp. P5_C11_2]
MCAIRGAASGAWMHQPPTSISLLPSFHATGPVANDNRARKPRNGWGAADALAIAWRLLLGASGIGMIATTACLLDLGR